MKLQSEFKSKARAMGATTWMLGHLVDSVVKGEPRCFIIAAHEGQKHNLYRQVLQALRDKNFDCRSVHYGYICVMPSTEIQFLTASYVKNNWPPRPPNCGIYVDHYVFDGGFMTKDEASVYFY